MQKIALLIISVVFLSGCAGMEPQYQRNMAQNAGLWGIIGAGTGAAVAAVTGGKVGKAAVLGGIAGAALGAANTPSPAYYDGYYYNCDALVTPGEREACERGVHERERRIQRERERRAYEYGYGYGYGRYRYYRYRY